MEDWWQTGEPKAYQGDWVAELAPETEKGWDTATGRALLGSSVMKAGERSLEDIVSGKYLSPGSNPWLKGTYEQALESALPAFDTEAVSAGRYGSDSYNMGKAKLVSDLATDIYGKAYSDERSRQMQGLGLAPTYAAEDWTDIDRLLGVGASKQAREQDVINAEMEKWNVEENLPLERLQQYLNMAYGAGSLGGVQTGTDPLRGPTAAMQSTCCFIMAEGGDLVDEVRELRDLLFSPTAYVAQGYRWMARWLVPAMRRNRSVRGFVRFAMTRPIRRFAELHKRHNVRDILYVPICAFWVSIWAGCGRLYAILRK